MNDKSYKLICSKCKGTNIETKVWIDANTEEILDSCSDDDIEDNYCRDCDKHVKFELIEINE